MTVDRHPESKRELAEWLLVGKKAKYGDSEVFYDETKCVPFRLGMEGMNVIWEAYEDFTLIDTPRRRPMTPMERVGYMVYHPHEVVRGRDSSGASWYLNANPSCIWEYIEHAPIDERGNVIGEWLPFEVEK